MSERITCDDESERKRKRGRPSVIESKGDPHLALKASAMRSAGYSWSEIASYLGIGKTTARRLARLYQKENESQTTESVALPDQKRDASLTSEHRSQCVSNSMDSDILGKLPKTFQIFSSLLEKVRDMDSRNRKIR